VDISPRSTLLPVNLSSSHAVATDCVIVPDAESTWLMNQPRNRGDSSDVKDRRRLGR